MLKVRCGQYSQAGVKAENQDAIGFYAPENALLLESKGAICAIADGISSSEQAREASHAAITGFIADYFSTPDTWSVKQSGGKVLTAINVWLCGQSHQFREISRGFATTFSAVIIKSVTAHLFHVGDARIYLFRNNTLEQLTQDHRIKLDEGKEYLGRALGVDYALEIDYKHLSVEQGDVFVLMTDGVYEFVADSVIKQQLSATEDPEQSAKMLCELALQNGGQDNVSCQLFCIDALADPKPDEVYAKLTALPFPPELYEGVILDGYRVLRELHASSTSQLYLAIDTETNQKVVLKTPSVNFEDDPAYLERFQLEEWIGRRIDNPHVVRIVEQPRPRRFLYYVMEYIAGKTLQQKLDDEGPLSLGEVRQLLPQLISGLRAFHRLDMLHQDLKPGNIMLSDEGVVKIIDFGSTRIAGIADVASPIKRKKLLGTREYTAPEYLLGEQAGVQADQFALGSILYNLLSGQLPYGKHFEKAINRQHLSRLNYQPLTQLQAEIPVWVDKAIQKSVQLNPQRRYEVLSELQTDLTKPNPAFLQDEYVPLIERHPLRFWQMLTILSVLFNLILLYLLVG
ncbi:MULTISPECIES: bifunctional protein-serine/threonine kinase/phosphatase [unclassified Methylophaga]|uniref:bifunctional protein-serine/threonine kinase/phosphatase n=1 Tax=unclassified Methylophaga TaxID=2629249 RepID=UPI000C92AFE6|nr:MULTISPECIES: bifunctional protein-serine/threonine kinase/phosphatase [unclassified Methylophaga]MBN46357.1 protein kinase [Methylophaga sp.]|tara:strand:- start:95676 stop:97388 length:1713 start_codon:yes stop_codon:yes gene_type:complete